MITSTLNVERRADGVFSAVEQEALLGFLGGYSGLTRDAYALDLRQFAAWCKQRRLALFDVARHDIEALRPPARGSRSGTSDDLAAVVHDHLAVPLRRRRRPPRTLPSGACATATPRLRVQRHGLDRNEVGAMLVTAGLAGARDHALVSLLALNGLRVSEAIGADIERLGLERGIARWSCHARAARPSPSRLHRAPPARSTWW